MTIRVGFDDRPKLCAVNRLDQEAGIAADRLYIEGDLRAVHLPILPRPLMERPSMRSTAESGVPLPGIGAYRQNLPPHRSWPVCHPLCLHATPGTRPQGRGHPPEPLPICCAVRPGWEQRSAVHWRWVIAVSGTPREHETYPAGGPEHRLLPMPGRTRHHSDTNSEGARSRHRQYERSPL